MNPKVGKENAKHHYSQDAKDYLKMYQKGYHEYPANLIRLNMVLKRLRENKIRSVLDVGCGSCGPMRKLLKEGFKVTGFDFSKEMVEEGKKVLEEAGFDPNLIFIADLENNSSIPNKKFDAILALGVFPHIVKEFKALSNMRKRLKQKGKVFIEFRNELFATYTLNKYSLDFFLNRVINLNSFPSKVSREVVDFYSVRLKMTPTSRMEKGKILYTDILAKFHNPLNIESHLFKPNGFKVDKIHFYHYHALPPIFKKKYPKLFRKLSLKLEKPNDWKGYLMASAYVVEASRLD